MLQWVAGLVLGCFQGLSDGSPAPSRWDWTGAGARHTHHLRLLPSQPMRSCPETVGWAPASRHHYWGSSPSSSLTHWLAQGNPDWPGRRKELGMKCRCEGNNQRKGMKWLKSTLFEDIRMGSPLSQSFSRSPKGGQLSECQFFHILEWGAESTTEELPVLLASAHCAPPQG